MCHKTRNDGTPACRDGANVMTIGKSGDDSSGDIDASNSRRRGRIHRPFQPMLLSRKFRPMLGLAGDETTGKDCVRESL